jgi:hypothetical protein
MNNKEKTDPPVDKEDLHPIPPHDLVEPDPMIPVPAPSDTESKNPKRPDLDWNEHED